MDNNLSEKVSKIMELAILFNPFPTNKEDTGNKPTVFVQFSGHISILNVFIYGNGWDANDEYNSYQMYRIRFDDKNKAEVKLDEIINELEQLIEKWGEV